MVGRRFEAKGSLKFKIKFEFECVRYLEKSEILRFLILRSYKNSYLREFIIILLTKK